MKKTKKNYLLEAVINILSGFLKGKLLDLGCGGGDFSIRLKGLGFDVIAADCDVKRFKYAHEIHFQECNIVQRLPFSDAIFDYVLLVEVIEHIYNPLFVAQEISRVLKPGGVLILSTPNILNIESRLRFLFEGSFNFFREPTLDYAKQFPVGLQNMHVVPWRYQELEYLLHTTRLRVERVSADLMPLDLRLFSYLVRPVLRVHCWLKERASKKKGGVSFKRMNNVVFSDAVFLGRHLIVVAKKEKDTTLKKY